MKRRWILWSCFWASGGNGEAKGMCGIVGYIGGRPATEILIDGLERLSYRGYDSAGIAVMEENGQMAIRKTSGKLERLKERLEAQPVNGFAGIGHTRWATHGEPTEQNAHPHTDAQGGIAVVHNGIIENHDLLRNQLEASGVTFVSQTDTEVIAHLLSQLYRTDMIRALLCLQKMLKGSYAIAVLCDHEPDRLFCVRCGSPLVMGYRDGEGFIASDIPALLGHTHDVVILEDHETGVLTRNGMEIFDAKGHSCQRTFFHVNWDQTGAEKSGFDHYMLKEIHEQPSALQSTFAPRSNLSSPEWLPFDKQEAQTLKKATIVACGTAYHAGVMAKYALETLARLPAEVEVASEYRYRQPVARENELFIAISQSGETADTLAALQKAKESGSKVMAICNAPGSSIVREAGENNTLYTYAGPEIAVASTKAYLTQTELLLMMAAALGSQRGTLPAKRAQALCSAFQSLPDKARQTLKLESRVRQMAARWKNCDHVFFIGRGMDYALSMEAALKLKEVSYLFSEAYAAGELKHGPIALLQPGRLVVASITQPHVLEKTLANLEEVRARGAEVLAVCPEKLAQRVNGHADELIVIPDTEDELAPLLAMIPLQLFAYAMAVERGCDVDQPRNLAKSVTVE